LLGDDPKDHDAKKIFSAAYVEPANPSMGFLYIILGGSEYDSVAQRVQSGMLLRSVLTTVVLGLIVALTAAFFVLSTQTRKLRLLASAIDIFRDSDFPTSMRVMRLRSGASHHPTLPCRGPTDRVHRATRA
jgi:two-component system, OmpR family, sensor kinase